MKLNMLEPDATTDGKIIFNFVNPNHPTEVITITNDVPDYKPETLIAAKKEAAKEAKAIAKEKVENKTKRERALDGLKAAKITAEEIAE